MKTKNFRNVGAFPAEAMLIFEKNKLILTKVQSWVDQLWRAAEFVVDKGGKIQAWPQNGATFGMLGAK